MVLVADPEEGVVSTLAVLESPVLGVLGSQWARPYPRVYVVDGSGSRRVGTSRIICARLNVSLPSQQTPEQIGLLRTLHYRHQAWLALIIDVVRNI